jgi:transmembrane 9 superfamily protein 2/4
MDKDAPTVYQHGVHVGIKGQYSGVSSPAVYICLCICKFSFGYISLWQSKEEKHFIHNHLTFLVKYHRDAETDFARIVSFEVKPFRL